MIFYLCVAPRIPLNQGRKRQLHSSRTARARSRARRSASPRCHLVGGRRKAAARSWQKPLGSTIAVCISGPTGKSCPVQSHGDPASILIWRFVRFLRVSPTYSRTHSLISAFVRRGWSSAASPTTPTAINLPTMRRSKSPDDVGRPSEDSQSARPCRCHPARRDRRPQVPRACIRPRTRSGSRACAHLASRGPA